MAAENIKKATKGLALRRLENEQYKACKPKIHTSVSTYLLNYC